MNQRVKLHNGRCTFMHRALRRGLLFSYRLYTYLRRWLVTIQVENLTF